MSNDPKDRPSDETNTSQSEQQGPLPANGSVENVNTKTPRTDRNVETDQRRDQDNRIAS